MNIDTGDTVSHGPSGEDWVVGVVKGEYVYPLGFPPCRAELSDCTLIKKATSEDRLMWLRDLAKGNSPDERCVIARQIVEAEGI